MIVSDKDIGAYLEGACALVNTAVTAGAGGDGAYADGEIITLADLSGRPQSAILVVTYETTLASSETLSIDTKIMHDDVVGFTGAAEYTFGGEETAHGVVETGVVTGAVGVVAQRIDLSGVKGFFRASVKPTLSASGTDTVNLAAVLVFGGAGENPVTS